VGGVSLTALDPTPFEKGRSGPLARTTPPMRELARRRLEPGSGTRRKPGRLGLLIAGLTAALGSGCEPVDEPSRSPGALREQIEALYDRAREAGEDVPTDALEWARSDMKRIGDWQYRIARLPLGPDAELAAALDALGEERWEAFWIEPKERELRVFLKRPSRSYLRMVPLGELGRLAPNASE